MATRRCPVEGHFLSRERKVCRQGEKHRDTATSLSSLGYLLQDMLDYPGARSRFEQALEINREVLGEKHPDTAISLSNLGRVEQSTGDYAAARHYFDGALAILEQTLPPDNALLKTVRSNLEALDQVIPPG